MVRIDQSELLQSRPHGPLQGRRGVVDGTAACLETLARPVSRRDGRAQISAARPGDCGACCTRFHQVPRYRAILKPRGPL